MNIRACIAMFVCATAVSLVPSKAKAAPSDTLHYSLPAFYSLDRQRYGDTLIEYRCYDKHDSLINRLDLQPFDKVSYVTLVKEYADIYHHYKDDNGVEHPLVVNKILLRYERTGNKRWMVIDDATNKMQLLKEMPANIVKRATVQEIDAASKRSAFIICQYYKVLSQQ